MEFRRPRGTRDFLPDETRRRRFVENVMRRTFERFGYEEIQTPTFETLELITAKSGEEIRSHLFHFKDKSNRDMALRPEFTAPVMRLYVNHLQTKPKPLKLYYFGNCFRYERPQSGRFREFWQAGVELIGSGYPEAEAEVIALAVETLRELRLKDFETHVGHVGILRKILEERGVGEEHQNIIMGLIDKGEKEQLELLLDKLKLGEDKDLVHKILGLRGGDEVIPKAASLLEGKKAQEEIEKLGQMLEKLRDFGIKDYRVNLGIARGLDYYTGMVFEIYDNKLKAQKQICGGGSYSLAEVFGGEPIPTCGFAFGFDRVVMAMEAERARYGEEDEKRFLIVTTGEKLLSKAIDISRMIREKFPCEVDLMRRRLGKALKYADSKGIPFVIIVGEDELKRGRVILRDMKTGTQREVPIERIIDVL
jgi:histidyl-tRNA synthetase